MARIRLVAAVVAVGAALTVAAPSQAATTLGQLNLANNILGCNDGGFIVQTGIANGPDYRVPPGGGVITGWSFRAWPGGADQILQLAIFGPDVSGDAVTFEALSAFEQIPAGTQFVGHAFSTRISVDAGERIGLYAKDTSGAEAFTWACASPTGAGNADRDIWGDLASPTIGGPPVTASNGQFHSQRVPVEATLEADADHDGFGDESQDQCPTESSTQGACPVPDTLIDVRPPKKTKKKVATFQFHSLTTGATFECQLDSRPFHPCSSPHLVRVRFGKHTFAVRATAKGQTDASPATDTWKAKRPPK